MKKKVLLFINDFYGYKDDIILELERQNCHVTRYNDEVSLNSFELLFSHLFKNYRVRKYSKYLSNVLESEKNNKYDEILVVFGGQCMCGKHLIKMKEVFPEAKIVYYAWDSVSNFKSIESLFVNADIAYTFDKNDSKEYRVNFLPLFYISKKENGSIERKWDISTVMTFYNNKANTLLKILEILPKNLKSNFFIRLKNKEYLKYMQFIHRKTYKRLEKYFTLNSLNREQCLDTLKESKAVIDCPIPSQNGLTMRTFEALALNTKLITTNKNIKKYEFYSENNIFVVDENTKEIPMDFFRKPFDNNYQLGHSYSISSFVRKLIDISN